MSLHQGDCRIPCLLDSLSCLQAIRKHFLSASDLNVLKWEELLKVLLEVNYEECQDLQYKLLKMSVEHELVLRYPMKLSYQQHFLKKLISQLEGKSIEVSEDIYNCYIQLQHKTDDSESYYRHFILPDEQHVTLCERKNFISEGTTGLCSWQGSFALSEWIIKNKNEFQDKTILELGSGTGLAGLTMLKCCNIKMFSFSDCHPEVLKQLQHNVILNNQISFKSESSVKDTDDKNDKSNIYYQTSFDKCHANILNLSWECIHDYDFSDIKPPDIIIASDIVYDDSLFVPLCNTLEYFLKGKETYSLLVCTIRNNMTFQTFLDMIASRNLCVTELPPIKPDFMPFSLETPIKYLKIYYSETKRLTK